MERDRCQEMSFRVVLQPPAVHDFDIAREWN
jgi:hypothetical protein